jgi:glycosyltransferase involved in cell wall biosynthesis
MSGGAIWLLLDSRGMGGIESHVAELAEGLAAAGRRVRVLLLDDHGPHPLKDRLSASSVEWGCAGGGAGLLGLLRRGGCALLHTHGYKAGIVGRFAALASGVPCVSTYHAGERPRGRVAVWEAADRWTGLASARRIAVSAEILRRLPWGGTLSPNFVTVPEAGPAGSSPSTVAFVGRMSPEKGPDLFCSLAAAAPGPRYLAYGDGPERARCEANARGVEFLGARPGMAHEWPAIGLLAVTSRAEGLPLAALEALAHGVPVAAFAVGGLPDAILDGVDGFLAPPGDVDALAARVLAWHAMSRGERLAMSAAARAKAESRFGREAGVERMLSVYASLGA